MDENLRNHVSSSGEASLSYLNKEHKSQKLFDFFNSFFEKKLRDKNFKIINPNNKEDRGSHISLKHEEAWRISKCLISPAKKNSVKIIVDYRPENIIRIALTPLYTSFKDVYSLCKRILEIIDDEEFKLKDNSKEGVT